MAVSEDKQKLIGMKSYPLGFTRGELQPGLERERIAVKFERSIDKNSTICFTIKCTPTKVHSPNDYLQKYF